MDNLQRDCTACSGTGKVPISPASEDVFLAAVQLQRQGQPVTFRALVKQTSHPYDTVYGCVRYLVSLGHLERATGLGDNGEHLYTVCDSTVLR